MSGTATEWTAEERELQALAQRAAEYQARRALSDAEMCRKFQDLGHTKTYKNMQAGQFEGYDVERQLANYRAAVAVLEAMDTAAEEREPLYDDLTAPLNLRRALLETFRETGNARVLVVQGDSGLGKSRAVEVMRERYGSRLLVVEVAAAWEDSVMALLGAILAQFGVEAPPAGRSERLAEVVRRLSPPNARRALVLDEAHHLGPRTLNTVKTLVNLTPGEFVLLALPSLWRRLELAAYEEARQLTTNRLAERIKLSLALADVRRMLARRAPGLNGTAEAAAKMLAAKAQHNGNLAFVRDVCRRLAGCEAPGLDDVAAAIAAEEASR
jgi:DNA transposition AAA+ family ATPase